MLADALCKLSLACPNIYNLFTISLRIQASFMSEFKTSNMTNWWRHLFRKKVFGLENATTEDDGNDIWRCEQVSWRITDKTFDINFEFISQRFINGAEKANTLPRFLPRKFRIISLTLSISLFYNFLLFVSSQLKYLPKAFDLPIQVISIRGRFPCLWSAQIADLFPNWILISLLSDNLWNERRSNCDLNDCPSLP